MRERVPQVAISLVLVHRSAAGIPPTFLPRSDASVPCFGLRSGAAWNDATGRDRPINDYRQHCAADVDHYVA